MNPARARTLRNCSRWKRLKLQIALFADQLLHMIGNDRLARFIASVDGFAKSLQFVVHALELQFAALLANVEMLVDEFGELGFHFVPLVAARLTDAHRELV